MPVVLRKSEHALLVSIGEAAEKLGVHADTLRRMIERKKIPSYRIGRAWRLKVEEVLQSLKLEPNPSHNEKEVRRTTSTSRGQTARGSDSLLKLLIAKQQKSSTIV